MKLFGNHKINPQSKVEPHYKYIRIPSTTTSSSSPILILSLFFSFFTLCLLSFALLSLNITQTCP